MNAAAFTIRNKLLSVVVIPMHRISLGALIIALGMMVDNAIVVTEGILVDLLVYQLAARDHPDASLLLPGL